MCGVWIYYGWFYYEQLCELVRLKFCCEKQIGCVGVMVDVVDILQIECIDQVVDVVGKVQEMVGFWFVVGFMVVVVQCIDGECCGECVCDFVLDVCNEVGVVYEQGRWFVVCVLLQYGDFCIGWVE